MCGRFVNFWSIDYILNELNTHNNLSSEYTDSYNIAPGDKVLVMLKEKDENILKLMYWGLKYNTDKKTKFRIINARQETLDSKLSFKHLIQNKRCIILSNGFYEWENKGNEKIPFYITLKENRIFGYAGLYNELIDDKGEKINTCVIITTNSNEKINAIHHRMPVILEKENFDLWLSNENFEKVKNLLSPIDSNKIELWEVSKKVNSPKNNNKRNIFKSDNDDNKKDIKLF